MVKPILLLPPAPALPPTAAAVMQLRQDMNELQLTLGSAAAALSQVDADGNAERANLLAWGAERLIELATQRLDAMDAASHKLLVQVMPASG